MKRFRPAFAIGIAAVGLAACDEVMSAMNVFLMSFYDGGGSTALIAPSGVNDVIKLAGRRAAARTASEKSFLDDQIKNLVNQYTDKSKWGVNLAYGLGADNTGNSDPASMPGRAALDLFVQSKSNTPMTANLDPFTVAGGAKDTINCNFPITLDKLPEESFDAMLKGDSIPYFLKGTVGYDLKSPTGDVLKSQNASMDIATKKLATRPNDDQTAQFLEIAKEYL